MKQAIFIVFFFMSFFSRLMGASDQEQRKIQIQKHEAEIAGAEALERRTRSTVFLKANGVPTMATLPVIEASFSVRMRSSKVIAERLVACNDLCGWGRDRRQGFCRAAHP